MPLFAKDNEILFTREVTLVILPQYANAGIEWS